MAILGSETTVLLVLNIQFGPELVPTKYSPPLMKDPNEV